MSRWSLFSIVVLASCGGEPTETTAATGHQGTPDGSNAMPEAAREAGEATSSRDAAPPIKIFADAACEMTNQRGDPGGEQCFSRDELLHYEAGIPPDAATWACPTIDELQPKLRPCVVSEGSCCIDLLCGPEARELPPVLSMPDGALVEQRCCYFLARVCGV
jgi:hypothetical protein